MEDHKITLYVSTVPLLVLYAFSYPQGYSIESFQEFCSLLIPELEAKNEYDSVHIELSSESIKNTLNSNSDLFCPTPQSNVALKESPRLNAVLGLLPQSVLETSKSVLQIQHEKRMSSSF